MWCHVPCIAAEAQRSAAAHLWLHHQACAVGTLHHKVCHAAHHRLLHSIAPTCRCSSNQDETFYRILLAGEVCTAHLLYSPDQRCHGTVVVVLRPSTIDVLPQNQDLCIAAMQCCCCCHQGCTPVLLLLLRLAAVFTAFLPCRQPTQHQYVRLLFVGNVNQQRPRVTLHTYARNSSSNETNAG